MVEEEEEDFVEEQEVLAVDEVAFEGAGEGLEPLLDRQSMSRRWAASSTR